MESNDKWTVVLTPEGEFMKIPSHPHHLEGKEVSFRVSATVAMPKKKKSWTPPVIRGVAFAAACLLLLVMVFPFFGGSQAYAAVTFDINPSLELEVDEQAKVIEAIPFNEEAQKLLDTVEWKGLTLSEVTLDIIEQAEQMGYMNEERQVLITTTYLDEEKENITLILEEATSHADQELTVVIVEGKKQWHEEAKEKQVPPGAYMLVKQAKEQGIELKEKEWQANQIEELPPVKGVTIIHPKGSKADKAKEIDKEKEEKKQKPDTKLDNKDKTKDLEKNAWKEIKENKKDKEKVEDQEKDNHQTKDNDKDKDKNEAENEREKNELSKQNQKHSQNEKGPSGPPSHEKKELPLHDEKDDDNKRKEKDRGKDREKDKEKEKDKDMINDDRGKKEKD